MQMPKITFAYLTIIGCFFFVNSFAQSGQVLRIKSSNCAYNTKSGTTNFATGFVYKENGRVVGVITALHAVCGCSSISAEDNFGEDYFSLKISKADIENDIALLTSSEIISNFNTGLEFSDFSASVLANKKVSMFAYPYGIELNIDTKDARVRETPTAQLKKFVKYDVEESLKDRGSPNINKYVLNLQLEITPGCSGAPILFENKVIGVANGGLDEGRTHVCWAIPTQNIRLTPINSLGSVYLELGKKNPNNLFILTCDIEGNEGPSNLEKIQVGNLIWMKNNLDYEVSGSWYHENVVTVEDRKKYGRLYTYEAAKNACNSLGNGWRLPTQSDWQQLIANNYNSRTFNSGYGGYRDPQGNFKSFNVAGTYWTSSPADTPGRAVMVHFFYNDENFTFGPNSKTFGYSCRCVRDK